MKKVRRNIVKFVLLGILTIMCVGSQKNDDVH